MHTYILSRGSGSFGDLHKQETQKYFLCPLLGRKSRKQHQEQFLYFFASSSVNYMIHLSLQSPSDLIKYKCINNHLTDDPEVALELEEECLSASMDSHPLSRVAPIFQFRLPSEVLTTHPHVLQFCSFVCNGIGQDPSRLPFLRK